MSIPRGHHLVVIGGGWAGLSAAVAAADHGWQVSVLEMAGQLGGRSRSQNGDAPYPSRDCGQHIAIGAYVETLQLLHSMGMDPSTLFCRVPLSLVGPDGRGLRVGTGAPPWNLLRGILKADGHDWIDRCHLVAQFAIWQFKGFLCPPDWTVERLCSGLPKSWQDGLIGPLCVSALNTPMSQASAQVFLRVLQDGLLAGPGGSDLLIPKVPLSGLLAEPARRFIEARGGKVLMRHRVGQVLPLLSAGQPAPGAAPRWRVDDIEADAVVLAASPVEALRLVNGLRPALPAEAHEGLDEWMRQASALKFSAISTAVFHSPGARLPAPMVQLHSSDAEPGHFAFDHGLIHGEAHSGRWSIVASASDGGLHDHSTALAQALMAQTQRQLQNCFSAPLTLESCITEKRATWLCTPGLKRPTPALWPGLVAAGDYLDGPYPATIEAAVRSGRSAFERLQSLIAVQE